MSEIKHLSRFLIEFYKKGSIISNIENKIFYFPQRNGRFSETPVYSVNDGYYYLIDNSLDYLGSENDRYDEDHKNDFYLVKEDIVVFELVNDIPLLISGKEFDNESYYESEIEYIGELFDDIKNIDEFRNIDDYGVSSIYVNAIISEKWSRSMDDWDCYISYKGIVRTNFNIFDILTDKSKESLKLKNENRYDRYDFSDIEDMIY